MPLDMLLIFTACTKAIKLASYRSYQEFIIYIDRESIQRSIALSKGTALKCYAISSIRLRRERPVDRC